VVVRYADSGPSLSVREIHTWNRDDLTAPVMSASSGPKDYIKNQIYALFQQRPAVYQVMMVRAGGPPFLLLRETGGWIDVTGSRVVMASE